MPLLSTKGAASAQGFGMFASLGGPYWIGTLSSSQARAITQNPASGAFLLGRNNSASNYGFLEVSYSNSGSINFQNSLSDNSVYNSARDFYSATSNSSGEVYAVGDIYNTNYDLFIAKYNSSGVIQWQRSINGGSNDQGGRGVCLDSSGNAYMVGNVFNSTYGNNYSLIVKYNSSGSQQWQQVLFWTGNSAFFYSAATDSSQNVYAVGEASLTNSSGGYQNSIIAKYNSSGTLQWKNSFGNGVGFQSNFNSIVFDSSDNFYAVGLDTLVNLNSMLIAKFNSSGVVQWQRILTSANFLLRGFGVTIDQNNNIYAFGKVQDYPTNTFVGFVIAKYNSSGVIQWQRTLIVNGNTNMLPGFDGITSNGTDAIYVTGSGANSPTNSVIAKLPSDGSKTGTYVVGGVSYVYAASSFTDQASSMSVTTSSINSSSSFYTEGTPTLTTSATALTSAVTTL